MIKTEAHTTEQDEHSRSNVHVNSLAKETAMYGKRDEYNMAAMDTQTTTTLRTFRKLL